MQFKSHLPLNLQMETYFQKSKIFFNSSKDTIATLDTRTPILRILLMLGLSRQRT